MNKEWLSLCVIANDNQTIISSYFDSCSIGNQFKKDSVIIYFSSNNRKQAQNIVDDIIDKYDFEYKWKRIGFENWMNNWRDSFKPIKINNKVIVAPDWDRTVYHSDYIVKICPAMAFGTGHHESTQLMIEQMIKLNIGRYDSLLDLGTGSGILSILAKKMGINKVKSIDNDSLCEDNFYQNCKLSNVKGIDFKISDVHSHNDYDYDIILANIDKRNIIKILDKYQKSRTKAIMILAGLLDIHLKDIEDCIYLSDIKSIQKKGEWISLVVENKELENE